MQRSGGGRRLDAPEAGRPGKGYQKEEGFTRSSLEAGGSDGTLLQYSCLENPMDGGAWWAAVHGVATSWTRLSDFTFTFHFHTLEKEMATHSCSCLENPRDG